MSRRPDHRPAAPHRARAWLGLAAFLLGLALPAAAAPTAADEVIVPGASVAKAASTKSGTAGTGAFTIAAVVGLAGAGGWLLWRGRSPGRTGLNRGGRQLAVEETRSLGGRQFLVVASYRDQKFLLGVCPGRIDLLAPLPANPPSSSSANDRTQS